MIYKIRHVDIIQYAWYTLFQKYYTEQKTNFNKATWHAYWIFTFLHHCVTTSMEDSQPRKMRFVKDWD